MNAKEILRQIDDGEGIPMTEDEQDTILRALRLLAAAEANDGSTPETDDAWTIEYASDNFGEAINQAAAALTNREQISGRLERERNGLAARVGELEAEIVRLCKLPRESFTKHLNLSHDQRSYSWHEIQYLLEEWGREQVGVLVRFDPKTKSTGHARGK